MKGHLERDIQAIEAAFTRFEAKLYLTLDIVAPLVKVNNRPKISKSQPWYTKELVALKQTCRKKERKWLKTNLAVDKREYRLYAAIC